MKKLAVVVAAYVLGTMGASAADLAAKAPPPVIPFYSWAGIYVGANGGGGWSTNCWDVTNFFVPVASFREGCHDASGAAGGGQMGYRWQFDSWVIGVEAQGDIAALKASNVSLFIPALTNNSKVQAFGLFTGQVGYAWNNVLWYVKGGAAVNKDKYRGMLTGTSTQFDSASEQRWGGAVGTGLEYGFLPNWSVAFEYDHFFMGHHDLNFISAGGGTSRTDTISQDVNLFTARINYRFGGPVVAKY